MTPGNHETFDWIYKLRKEQKTSRAIYVAEEWIKNLLSDQDFDTCNEIIDTLDIERAGEWLSLAIYELLANATKEGIFKSEGIKPLRHKIMLYLLDQYPLPYVAEQMNCTKKELLQTIQTMKI